MRNKMSHQTAYSYNALFSHTLKKIKEQSAGKGCAGLLIHNGPTGGGKTSSLHSPSDEPFGQSILEQVKKEGLQAIFITHRWNILQELAASIAESKDSDQQPLTASIIYSQMETITAAIIETPLPHESTQTAFPKFRDCIATLNTQKCWITINPEMLLDIADQIQNKKKQFDQVSLDYGAQTDIATQYQQDLSNTCSFLEKKLIENLFKLEKNNPDRALLFRSHPWIQRIFPAIKWKQENQHVLIMTTHKLFHSFFDGHAYLDIANPALKNHVIFIDEFDYQAAELQTLLAKGLPIQDVAECIGQLLYDSVHELQSLKQTHRAIYDQIWALRMSFLKALKDQAIPFGKRRSLYIPNKVYKDDPFKLKSHCLFRANRLISNSHISLIKTNRGYDVYTKEKDIPAEARPIKLPQYISILETYLRKFCTILQNLNHTDESITRPVRDLVSMLLDYKNDSQETHYTQTLPKLTPYLQKSVSLPELENVRQGNLIPHTYENIWGFALWAITQGSETNIFDRLKLKIKRAFLPTTAEGLLLNLASRNLVIGLSATAYIDRALNNFDLQWLNSSLDYIAKARTPGINLDRFQQIYKNKAAYIAQPIPYLADKEDVLLQEKVIAHLKSVKEAKRAVQVSLIQTLFLQEEADSTNTEQDSLLNLDDQTAILSHLPASFFEKKGEYTTLKSKIHRQDIVLKLINTLFLAQKNHQYEGQIAFVNSMAYFQKWLLHTDATNSRKALPSLQTKLPLPDVEKSLNINALKKLIAHRKQYCTYISVNHQPIFIWFLNAECQKETLFNRAYQQSFNLGVPVLIITQSESASNGISLGFRGKNQLPQDLSIIYLIEEKHFFFNFKKDLNTQHDMSAVSDSIRDFCKLHQKREISTAKFSHDLPKLLTPNGTSDINEDYKTMDDYLLNIMAILQQKLGRLERVWGKVSDIKVYMPFALMKAIYQFSEMVIHTNHQHCLSHLNQEVIRLAREKVSAKRPNYIEMLQTPSQGDQEIVGLIEGLIIPAIRETRITGDLRDARYIQYIWDKLGKAILAHDYSWSLKDEPNLQKYLGDNPKIHHIIRHLSEKSLLKWACFKFPEQLDDLSQIRFTTPDFKFFKNPNMDGSRYFIDDIYGVIQQQRTLSFGFRTKGFQTSSTSKNTFELNYAFHPYIVKSLLKGRVGEQAIQMLLKDLNIPTEDTLIDPHTFENYDFHVPHTPFRIDAKFWSMPYLKDVEAQYYHWRAQESDATRLFQNNADGENSHLSEYSPNALASEDDPQKIIAKLLNIRKYEGAATKLVIINLIDYHEVGSLKGYDANLAPIAVEKADVLVLNSCLNYQNLNQYSPGFLLLTKIIRAYYRDQSLH